MGRGGQLGFDRFKALFPVGRQVGPAGAEVCQSFLEITFLHPGEGLRFRRVGVGSQQVPERLVQHELREECGDLRQHFVVGPAQGGGIADCIQMPDFSPSFAECVGAVFKGEEGASEGHPPPVGAADLIEFGLGMSECEGDVRNDMFRTQGGPADMQRGI